MTDQIQVLEEGSVQKTITYQGVLSALFEKALEIATHPWTFHMRGAIEKALTETLNEIIRGYNRWQLTSGEAPIVRQKTKTPFHPFPWLKECKTEIEGLVQILADSVHVPVSRRKATIEAIARQKGIVLNDKS